MPTRNGGASSNNSLRSDSGPYGGAEWRANEAKRGGSGVPDFSVADVREIVRFSDRREQDNYAGVANGIKNTPAKTSQDLLDDFLHSDFSNKQYNYQGRGVGAIDSFDVFNGAQENYNVLLAYRDLLENGNGNSGTAFVKSKEEIAQLDEAILNYAEVSRVSYETLEYGRSGTEESAEALANYNRAVLNVRNVFADIIVPSKRGPRNG